MSTIKCTTIQNLSGVEVYTAKAWVNFNGTGTVAIRASGNVSSITDNGAGDYTVNFITAMVDANYSAVVTSQSVSNGSNWIMGALNLNTPLATTSVRLIMQVTGGGGGGILDTPIMCVSIFR